MDLGNKEKKKKNLEKCRRDGERMIVQRMLGGEGRLQWERMDVDSNEDVWSLRRRRRLQSCVAVRRLAVRCRADNADKSSFVCLDLGNCALCFVY